MEQVIEELRRVIGEAEMVLRQVNEEDSARPVLPGGWSRKELLGHLIDSVSNNHQRFVRAALADSLEFPAYDQAGNVRVESVDSAAWPMLVDLWSAYNRYLVHVIRHLPANKLDVVCRIGSNEPVTLGFLVKDYVRHLIHHLEQIGATAG